MKKNMTFKERNKKRRKTALIGAVSTASLIVIGTTFAWFTSKDEVTNRLTASADYGVSIVEDFTPPETWVPGQEINKDVAAVNTGNVDAFVRMRMDGAFRVTAQVSGGKTIGTTVETAATPTDEKDAPAGLVWVKSGADTFLTEKLDNTRATVINTSNDTMNTEVQAVQAGGYIVYSPIDAEKNTKINPLTWKPTQTGLYIFRREIKTGTTTTYDFSGYYFINDTDPVYLGLKTKVTTDGDKTIDIDGILDTHVTEGQDGKLTISADGIAAVKLNAYATTTYSADQVIWDYTNATATDLVATASVNSDAIKVNVKLANLAADPAAADQWYVKTDAGKTNAWFYYTDDVEAGGTSAKLVDAVTLDPSVTQDAYYNMDFDLTLKLESVQVTKAADENESDLPIKAQEDGGSAVWASGDTGATGTASVDATKEITIVNWN